MKTREQESQSKRRRALVCQRVREQDRKSVKEEGRAREPESKSVREQGRARESKGTRDQESRRVVLNRFLTLMD
jgi:hypothetical protein